MRYAVGGGVTTVLLAACTWLWVNTAPLFWGTIVSEFQFLLPFAAIVVFLSLVNWLSGLAGKES